MNIRKEQYAIAQLCEWLKVTVIRFGEFLNRNSGIFLVLFCIAYGAATVYRAERKLFWFDELFTFYVSRLPDLASFWNAMNQGVDFNPPLLYGLTWLSASIFGWGHIATRLPAILGFGVFCLSLYRFVSVRTSPLAGFVSMLFPLVTGAYWYAYEARSYGIVLGFAGIALICWQAAACQRGRRMWWLVGLSGALVCATLTHGYAAVLFVPIVLGEIARTINYRRVDWPIWTAFVVALPAMLVPLRLLVSVTHNLSTTSTTLFPRATLPMLGETYKSLLGPSTLVLSGLLLVWSIAEIMGSRRVLERSDDYKPKLHEMVALFTFVAVPIIVFVLSKVAGAPFFTRYSIICIAGFAGLLGFATARKTLVGMGLVGLLITHIGMDLVQYARRDFIIETSSSSRLSTDSVKFSEMYAAMATASEQTLPIVLLDFAEFLPAFHYAPPDLVPRLYYIIRSDPIGEEILKLKNCCNVPGNVVYLADFLSTHRKFLAYSNSRSYWKLDSFFIKAGANVTILGAHRESLLVSITLP